jgi:hypothetical protein
LPKCPNCGIFQNCVSLTHQQSIECQRWTRILQERETYDENMNVVEDTTFTVNGIPIKKVSEFRYLGRILEDKDSDWAAIQLLESMV